MSDDTKGTGGSDQTSGAGADKGGNQTVAYDTYKKAMDDLKETQRKLKEIETKSQSEIEAKLKEQGDWKALAESREAKVKELEQRVNGTEAAITDSIKLSAFQKHLGGKMKSEKYFDFVDTNQIAINPETKAVDEMSVKSVVAEFLKEHRDLVDFGKKPGMPRETKDDSKKISNGVKTVDEMSSAELEKHILDLASKGLIK
jgi:hypothetical protein